ARMEQRLLQAARLVTAVTPEDAAVFNEEGEAREIFVLSPGRWAPGPATGEAAPELSQRPRRVILSGSCEWVVKQHNMKRFLATALPVLQPAGIAVTVVGKMPEAFARELQTAFPAAEIHANVPDPSPFLDSARVGVIPEEAGGGFKLKALEYVF